MFRPAEPGLDEQFSAGSLNADPSSEFKSSQHHFLAEEASTEEKQEEHANEGAGGSQPLEQARIANAIDL